MSDFDPAAYRFFTDRDLGAHIQTVSRTGLVAELPRKKSCRSERLGGSRGSGPMSQPYLGRMLFPNRDRTDAAPRRHDETLAVFLERVAGPYWDRVRQLLERWLERVSDEETQNDLAGRLLDSDHRQHRSAFWELYLHESFLRGGWQVFPHPALGTGSRPDFQLCRGGESVLVEAFVVSETSDADRAEENRRDQALAVFERLGHERFMLSVAFDTVGAGPLGRSVLPELRGWLDGLDWETLRADLDAGRTGALPTYCLTWSGWEIELQAWPRYGEAVGAGRTETVAAVGSGGAFMVPTAGALRAKLEEKASKYGRPDGPFLLAGLLDGVAASDWSVEQVILGTEAVQFAIGGSDVRSIRRPDGFWGGPETSRKEYVSGVLIGRGLQLNNAGTFQPRLWHNPRAHHSVPELGLPWASATFDHLTGVTHRRAGASPASFFGLSEYWPGPDPMFPENAL